jgi:hypothetical protein
MAFTVKQDVAVVTVFYLQEIAEQRVACHRLHEGVLCREVPLTTKAMGLNRLGGLILQVSDPLGQLFATGCWLARLLWSMRIFESLLEVLLKACEVWG